MITFHLISALCFASLQKEAFLNQTENCRKGLAKNEIGLLCVSFVNFRYCERATKYEIPSHLFMKLLSDVKPKWEIFSNFCGLLRISELYKSVHISYRLFFFRVSYCSTWILLWFTEMQRFYKKKFVEQFFEESVQIRVKHRKI